MKAALYCRVSTNGNGQSPEMQIRELREYCERRGWQVAGEYVDKSIRTRYSRTTQATGSATHRTNFEVGYSDERWPWDRISNLDL